MRERLRHHAGSLLLWGSIILAVALAALVLSGRASAGERPELDEATALARLCVNESGRRAYLYDDCAAIHDVLRFRAQHIYRSTYLEALHRYSRGTVIDPSRGCRPWVTDLWPDARRPEGWPKRLPWTGRRQRDWRRSYEHAVDVFRGNISVECYALTEGDDGGPQIVRPHTWARSDVHPDASLNVLDCGRTLNVFWSVPRYERRWPRS